MEKISLEAYSLGTYEILSLDTERSIQKTIFQQLTSLFTTGTQTSETHRHIYAHDGQPASVAVLLHTIREQMADKQYPSRSDPGSISWKPCLKAHSIPPPTHDLHLPPRTVRVRTLW